MRGSSRSGSKESSANSQDRMEVAGVAYESGHGNKHVDVASSGDGGRGWPFEQPARPRDFQSREDR